MCHKLGEIQDNCDPRRKPKEGNEKLESPKKIRIVGKYVYMCYRGTRL